MSEQDQPSPAVVAARAFRTRLAAATAVALVLCFVVLVLATPRAVSGGDPTGPTTSLSVGPPEPAAPPPTAADPAGDVTPASDGPEGDAADGTDLEAPGADGPEAAETPERPEPAAEATSSTGERAGEPAGGPARAATPLSGPGAPLWGRWYRAEHLRQGDQTAIVAGERPLFVGFLREPDRDRIVWLNGCNTFGATLTVTEDELDLDDLGGSVDDCDDETLADQELWLVELLAQGPRWRQVGGQLRLWSEERRLDLVEDPAGPGPPWS